MRIDVTDKVMSSLVGIKDEENQINLFNMLVNFINCQHESNNLLHSLCPLYGTFRSRGFVLLY